MSDLCARDDESSEAHTVFVPEEESFSDDMTEVNLNLAGALESVMEAETALAKRPSPRHGGAVPVDFARVEIKPATLRQRPQLPSGSWAGNLAELVHQEFDADDDLPELASGEFLSLPATEDLTLPAYRFGPRFASMVQPTAVRVVVGRPITPLSDERLPDLRPHPRGLVWVASALLLGAATMLAVWSFRPDLLALAGL